MMIRKSILVFLGCICVTGQGHADSGISEAKRALYNNQSDYAIVHFHGDVLVSPCILASESAEQDIDMGVVTAREFHRSGDRSGPVGFIIRFKDCLAGATQSDASSAASSAGYDAKLYISKEQVIILTFIGESDPVNPELIRIHGTAGGLGLRLFNAKSRPLAINQAQQPWLLSPGGNTLSFSASLESTRADISAGDYYGMMRLMMEYL